MMKRSQKRRKRLRIAGILVFIFVRNLHKEGKVSHHPQGRQEEMAKVQG